MDFQNRRRMSTTLKITIFFVFLFAVSAFAETSGRPKIGVVLSGGGAKGFAHVGLLKMLDSLHIPVDYIAGTSMGGIVGALYSIGYNGLELESLAYRKDWQEIFTDKPPREILPYFQKKETGRYQLEFGFDGLKPTAPSGLIFGQKISLLFSSLTFPYEHIGNFDELPIPFRCVAADLVTGNMVVLQKGSLAKAMRSTMSIPTIFSPVEYGDSLLVDGGIINNLPVDVVQNMGADIIIASDVGHPTRDREELNTALHVLEQSISMVGMERWKENRSKVDVSVRPNMDGFTLADFDNAKIRVIIKRGNRAAHQVLPQLVALQDSLNAKSFESDENIANLPKDMRIHGVQIIGYTTIPFSRIYQQLNLKVGERFDPGELNRRITRMKTSGDYADITYEVVPTSDEYVRILVRVKEQKKPVIHGVNIAGNKALPFSFIYRLLDVHPLDKLNIDYLNDRIMEVYGLGYFESILYDITPISENQVEITFTIRELPLRRLRVGLRYDDLHQLVAAVSIQATNVLVPGLRIEHELQFAGLTRFRLNLLYPSRTLDLPIYPFGHLDYEDIPLNIYNDHGDKIANYKDRSLALGAGIGFLIGKSWNTQVEYQFEQMMLKPNIAYADQPIFSSRNDQLRKVFLRLNVDNLDNVLLPRKGLVLNGAYENSAPELQSDVDYKKISASFDQYETISQKHTLRFHGFYGYSSPKLPIYKFFRQGGPDSFVGAQYDQIYGTDVAIVRLDYRYQFKRDIFFKIMANTAFNFYYTKDGVQYHLHNLRGYGVGVKFLSPVGPLQFILSRGDKNFLGKSAWQNVYYVQMGYKF